MQLNEGNIESIADLIRSRLRLIAMASESGDYQQAEKTLAEILEDFQEFEHEIKVKASFGRSLNKFEHEKNETNLMIKGIKRHLGELEDWVHINNRDAQLKSLYHLTEAVDELNKKIRGI